MEKFADKEWVWYLENVAHYPQMIRITFPNGEQIVIDDLLAENRGVGVYRVGGDLASKVLEHFEPYRRFADQLAVKWVERQEEASAELESLNQCAQSPHYSRFPWVHPQLLAVERKGKAGWQRGSGILMEFVGRENITDFFARVSKECDPRLVCGQFALALSQTLETVKFLNQEVGTCHGDLKPENLFFKNNLLKIIDFNGARRMMAGNVGTARYVPNYAIADDDLSTEALALLDIQLAVTVFLEVLVKCMRTILHVPARIRSIIDAKSRIARHARDSRINVDEEYSRLNVQLLMAIQQWLKENPTNVAIQVFSCLTVTPAKKGFLSRCTQKAKFAIGDFAQGLLDLLSGRSLTAANTRLISESTAPRPLAKNFETLLSAFTTDLFSSFYPLVYFDFSEETRYYDQPAAAASTAAFSLIQASEETVVLDVGSGFGTAAFQAISSGFSCALCFDNNPAFQTLSNLVWSHCCDEAWERAAVRLLNHSFLEIASCCDGFETTNHTREHFLTRLRAKQRDFSLVGEKILGWKLGDYWSLNERKAFSSLRINRSDEFNFIICNHVLHWPVMDYERLRDRLPQLPALSLARDHLVHLLTPLLKLLAKGGVLAIIEPSLFFMDDLHLDSDRHFHSQRFSQLPFYKEMWMWAGSQLLVKHFGFPTVLPERKPMFTSSAFKREIGRELDCDITILPKVFPANVHWRSLLLGEFAMRMWHFSDSQLKAFTKNGTKGIRKFYDAFRNHIDKQTLGGHADLLDTVYIVLIQKRG